MKFSLAFFVMRKPPPEEALALVLFPLAFRVEAPSTFKELLTVMPYKPLPVQVTVEPLTNSLPAERPWDPLSLKETSEPFAMSKCEPLEPLPLLLITVSSLASTLTKNVPAMPERLWSSTTLEPPVTLRL